MVDFKGIACKPAVAGGELEVAPADWRTWCRTVGDQRGEPCKPFYGALKRLQGVMSFSLRYRASLAE